MIVMPANVTSPEVRQLMHEYPGSLGNLFSPGAWQTPHGVYALDNGRFTPGWSQHEWWNLIGKASLHHRAPEWVLCPDVVGNWGETLVDWGRWVSPLRELGWPVAMAVQDGATPADIDSLEIRPHVVFVGGSTRWKWRTVERWAAHFPRVHVGRVNSLARAYQCFQMGVESIDGTGWMRTTRQRELLRKLLGMMRGSVESQTLLIPFAGRAS